MIRIGNPPYLEVSSKGDRRFSALYARIGSRNFDSIEQLYQSKKLFDGKPADDWRAAKGKKADNQEECNTFYVQLWREYLQENPHLIEIVKSSTGLSDMFGQEGHMCQAIVLWQLCKG